MASIRDGDKACICYGAKQRMQKKGVLNGIECIVGPLSAGKSDCYDNDIQWDCQHESSRLAGVMSLDNRGFISASTCAHTKILISLYGP